MMHKTARLSRALVLVTVGTALLGAVHADPVTDLAQEKASIRMVIGSTWDTPEAKVVIDPVVVDGEHAIASWTQGEHGGRALLRRRDAAWAVILCSGDPLKEAPALIEAGVPESSAKRLAAKLAAVEQLADPRRVRLFSTFEGVMKMEDNGSEHHQAPHHSDHHH